MKELCVFFKAILLSSYNRAALLKEFAWNSKVLNERSLPLAINFDRSNVWRINLRKFFQRLRQMKFCEQRLLNLNRETKKIPLQGQRDFLLENFSRKLVLNFFIFSNTSSFTEEFA